MQTTSQETQALSTVAEQAARDKRTEFIYLICFLRADQSAHALAAQRGATLTRNKFRDTAYTSALWDGYCALRDVADDNARKLTREGKLLFAFQGTTVLQGCGAA